MKTPSALPRGLTLLEAVIAMAIASLLASGAYFISSRIYSGSAAIGAGHLGQSEIDLLLADIRKQFEARLPGNFSSIPAPFHPVVGGISCTGLSITQLGAAGGGTTRTVNYNRNSAAALLTPLFLTTADHSTALQPLPNQ
jgi:prepilin-type N-terminal cleavage/methylation domain-containing protein